mmetsp:Transcript_23360/g.37260  ORF Transcript_23360/g.37260 Transcript_23360/m.37260 type:complete len:383 (+) Transcript_23360:2-1150(+)
MVGTSSKDAVDLYELLKVDRGADSKTLKRAYFALALKLHPDKNADGDDEAFKALRSAYDILKDPVKRKKYDRTGCIDDDSTESFWEAYKKYRAVEVTEEDINGYVSKYKNSADEQGDLIEFFNRKKGDVSYLLMHIIASTNDDCKRFVDFFENALREGKLSKEYEEMFMSTKDKILSTEELEKLGQEEDDCEDEDEDEDYKEGDQVEDDEGDDGEMDDFIVNDEDEEDVASEGGHIDDDEDEEEEEEEENAPPKFQKGQNIRARWNKGPNYFDGVILKVNKKRKNYDIKYDDDGTIEKQVAQDLIKVSKKKKGKKRKVDKNPPPPIEEDKPKAKKKRGQRKQTKEDNLGYDGDLDALRAAMGRKAEQREDAFAAFASRYAGR